ncbi:MAG: hypothetical protein ACT4QC_07835 [Planctomycetaceae bacterium]
MIRIIIDNGSRTILPVDGSDDDGSRPELEFVAPDVGTDERIEFAQRVADLILEKAEADQAWRTGEVHRPVQGERKTARELGELSFTDPRTKRFYSWLLRHHGGQCQEILSRGRASAGQNPNVLDFILDRTTDQVVIDRVATELEELIRHHAPAQDMVEDPYAAILVLALGDLNYDEIAEALAAGMKDPLAPETP